MASKLIVGLKIWLVLLLGGLIMLPITLVKIFLSTINPILWIFLLIASLLITFFVYGWLFIKFKKWIFR